MLGPAMLEVKKLRTIHCIGDDMDAIKVLEKTHKYLVSILTPCENLPDVVHGICECCAGLSCRVSLHIC